MEDRWFGNAFQIFGAIDENDLEAAMVVLRGGMRCWELETSSAIVDIFHLRIFYAGCKSAET